MKSTLLLSMLAGVFLLQEQDLEIGGSYDELAPAHRRLVDVWFHQYNEIMDPKSVLASRLLNRRLALHNAQHQTRSTLRRPPLDRLVLLVRRHLQHLSAGHLSTACWWLQLSGEQCKLL